jgi:hypothetical protein
MNIKENEVYTFKLASSEEIIAKVIGISDTFIQISEPVSIAPNQKGLGMIPSLYTADSDGDYRLNINSVTIYTPTADSIKVKYIEATTGITVPEKKIVLG